MTVLVDMLIALRNKHRDAFLFTLCLLFDFFFHPVCSANIVNITLLHIKCNITCKYCLSVPDRNKVDTTSSLSRLGLLITQANYMYPTQDSG